MSTVRRASGDDGMRTREAARRRPSSASGSSYDHTTRRARHPVTPTLAGADGPCVMHSRSGKACRRGVPLARSCARRAWMAPGSISSARARPWGAVRLVQNASCNVYESEEDVHSDADRAQSSLSVSPRRGGGLLDHAVNEGGRSTAITRCER